MDGRNKSDDFLNLSTKIYRELADHERNIKQHCVKSSIISLADFYTGLEREVNEINSEITPSKDCPAIADFADIFKAFDEYPPNLKMLKKAPLRELQRLNSTSKDITLVNSLKECTISIHDVPKPQVSTASETYGEYKKFQQKLDLLLKELQEKTTMENYVIELCQVNAFGKQLEKLLPSTKDSEQVFGEEEKQKLQSLLANLDDFNFIRSNQGIFLNIEESYRSPRTESLSEIISYMLSSLAML